MTNYDISIADYPDNRVKIKCDACIRRRLFRKAELMERFGSAASMSYVIAELMNCPHSNDSLHPCSARAVIRTASGSS